MGELGEKGGGWVSDGRREGETGRDSEKRENRQPRRNKQGNSEARKRAVRINTC